MFHRTFSIYPRPKDDDKFRCLNRKSGCLVLKRLFRIWFAYFPLDCAKRPTRFQPIIFSGDFKILEFREFDLFGSQSIKGIQDIEGGG